MEEEHLDVLQNIEFCLVASYHENEEMTDANVMVVLEALGDMYVAEKIGRAPRDFGLTELEQAILDAVHKTCEWRLGRAKPGSLALDEDAEEGAINIEEIPAISIDVLLMCIKRLRRSVERWNKTGGRRGYLDFVSQFIV